ncbi:MAG TPA: M20/M25/M40 family metallo-hydrolase [Chthonomonadales bacterium]|nr:M20/M25/M40 family metallo-hydrolase [Chthonomonadales bacterium]
MSFLSVSRCLRVPAQLRLIVGLAPLFLAASYPAEAQRTPAADIVRNVVRNIEEARLGRTINRLVGFGTRSTLSDQNSPSRGIGATRDWLYRSFLALEPISNSRLVVEKQSFVQPAGRGMPSPITVTNVVATLPGDLPAGHERYVIVSGHYDSRCTNVMDGVHDAPGADDDGSGTAAVLETARAMCPFHFHATVVFMCVAGEEQGLFGSTYYSQQAHTHNWNVEAMLDNDIIGSSVGQNGVRDSRTVRLFSEGIASTETALQARIRRAIGGEEDSASRQLARFIKETANHFVRTIRVTLVARRDRYLRGGDHIPFNERGYAAVRFTEPNEDYRHQHQDVRTVNGVIYGDLPRFLDLAYLAKVARVNAAALAALALAPDVPKGAGLVTSGLSVDTELRWSPSTDPNVAGYEVVWRSTTEPVWTHARIVGKVTDYIVKGISKDNYFFGVRAVGSNGMKSPVAFPAPVR